MLEKVPMFHSVKGRVGKIEEELHVFHVCVRRAYAIQAITGDVLSRAGYRTRRTSFNDTLERRVSFQISHAHDNKDFLGSLPTIRGTVASEKRRSMGQGP